MKKSYLLIGLLLISSSILAATPKGTSVALGGGTVSPNSTLSVDLTRLVEDINYNISCFIDAKDASIMNFKTSGVYTYNNIPATLNGASLPGSLSTGANGKINAGKNTLVVSSYTRVFPSGSLNFKNLDDTVIATVSNCVANPNV